MITPSFGLTATERVLPRLALDFTVAALDPRVTFTRAAATATRVNASGFIESVAADTARFDFNPVTLACKGLLIEESRTNVQVYSEDFTQSPYVIATGSINATKVTGPDNLLSASQLDQPSGTTDAASISTTINGVSGRNYSFSIFVKKGTKRYIRFLETLSSSVGGARSAYFDLDNEEWVSQSTAHTVSFDQLGNGFIRLKVSFIGGITFARAVFWQPSDSSSSATSTGEGYTYFYGWQEEHAIFPTSYIPTEATAVTRNADVATMTGTNFSDWFNASEGTFVVQATTPSAGAFRPIAYLTDASVSNVIAIGQTAAGAQNFAVIASGVAQASFTGATIASTTSNTSAAYKVDSFAISVNGGSVSTDSSGTIPTVTQMQLGADQSNRFLSGVIKKVAYYPQRLLNAELQAFSK
jgi:hypothetical protein